MQAAATTGSSTSCSTSPSQERLLGVALTAPGSAMRDVAHQIADAIYEKILGVPGAFWTRIAYITQTGLGAMPAMR
jgi:Tol biopolymer transport system component